MSDELVQVCAHCGKVLSGPDAGEQVPNWPADPTGAGQRDVPTTHKGQRISHGGPCEDCRKGQYRQDMRKRYGHLWWRKLGKKSEDE